jgi:hypothetical protein
MNVRRFLALALALAVATSFLAVPAMAQGTQSSTLVGSVKDANGEALPGVQVTVTSDSLLGERTAFTGGNGDFVLRGLPPGQYKIVYALSGMATVERSITLELGRTGRSDAEMQVASVEETIVVRGEAPSALETTTIGANYDSETIDSLATSRTLFGIAQLAPGLTTNTPNGGQVTIGGAFAYDNVFLIDGVDTNDNLFGTSNNLFIEDAIEETQVLTNGISAEYGRFTGGVINAITKSGGNQFSGSLRGDYTNDGWREETPLEEAAGTKRSGPTNEILQATFGGYLLKDRLWFFLAGRDQGTTTTNPLPQTNLPLTSTNDNQRIEAKLTGNINSSHTLQAAYTDNATDQSGVAFGFSVDPRTFRSRSLPNTLAVARYNGVLTSSLFGELQYSEKEFQFKNSGGTSTDIRDSPFIGFGPLVHFNAPYFDATDPEDRNNEQLAASLSYFLSSQAAGSHDFKLGFEDFTSTRTGGNSQSSTSFVWEATYLTDAAGNPVLDSQGRLQPVFNNINGDPNPGDPTQAGGLTIIENWQAKRGAKIDIQTQSLYINDRWNLNDHWSFNLGFRYEDVGGDSSDGQQPVNSDAFVPRLAASYDIKGDGKYKVDVTYAEYAGKYSETQFGNTTNVGNPDVVYSFYVGPPGVGVDFAPGFDLNNYIPFAASFPTQSVFFDEGLSSPIVEEVTVSFGLELGRGGYVKATYTDRSTSNFVEDFIDDPLNPVLVVTPAGNQLADRQTYRNSDHPSRDYEAIQFQGRYRITNNWYVEGHWTHQFTNDGDFEGEGTNTPGVSSLFGDRPELYDPVRNNPTGRLNDFQEDRIRIWTTYNWDFGRAGNLGTSLLYNFDSGTAYSISATRVPFTAIQLARDPGYVGAPTSQTLFFGERGSGTNGSGSSFDLAINYGIPVWKSLEPWIKLDIRNVFNSDDQIGANRTVSPDFNGPLDSNGLPTNYIEGSRFGQATTNGSFITPREYRISAGIRF